MEQNCQPGAFPVGEVQRRNEFHDVAAVHIGVDDDLLLRLLARVEGITPRVLLQSLSAGVKDKFYFVTGLVGGVAPHMGGGDGGRNHDYTHGNYAPSLSFVPY